MTSKERVLAAISHQEPDRVPVFAGFVPKVVKNLEERYGIHDDIGVFLGNDIVAAGIGFENIKNEAPEEREFVSRWGNTYRRVKNEMDEYLEIVEYPLAGDESKLNSYRIPDPFEERQYDRVRNAVRKYGKEKLVAGACRQSIFETAWGIRGLEQFMMDMILNEDYTNTLLDKVMQFPLEACKIMIEAGVDMVWLGDDVSTQRSMMMSMDTWRKYFRSRYAQLIGEFKKVNPNIIIAYHCCGNCRDALGDLIDIGVDVLHSVQPLAMDPLEVKKEFGDKLTLFGGVDVQELLPFGTREEIFNEARRLIKGCEAGGGYIYSPAHYIQADTSVENIQAFYDAAREYGGY